MDEIKLPLETQRNQYGGYPLVDADGVRWGHGVDQNAARRIVAAVNHAEALAEALRETVSRLYVCGESLEDHVAQGAGLAALAAYDAARQEAQS